uniref:Uncharacterized protein n=1 Tax=Panagrolaimus sp. JU765 TaxID=591449 RepID=A0AC34Q746_9BILA
MDASPNSNIGQQEPSRIRPPAPAITPGRLISNFIVEFFQDGTMRHFDCEAFLSYTIWSTALGTVYQGCVINARESETVAFMKRFFSMNFSFFMAYLALPLSIAYVMNRKTQIPSLSVRRFLLIFLFGLMGLFRGYFWRTQPLPASTFFVPFLGNFIFYFFAKAFIDDRRQLVILSVLFPLVISMYGNVYYGFLYMNFVFFTIRNALTAFSGMQYYARTFNRRYYEIDLVHMGCKSLLLHEYLGVFSVMVS